MMTWLIETLIATSLLMLAVLVIRKPVRRMFGSGVAYALWALPLLRLALPPLPGRWHLSGFVTPAIDRSMADGIIFGVMNPRHLPIEITSHAVAHIDVVMANVPVRAIVVPPVVSGTGPSWIMLAIGLWAIGALLFIGYQLIGYRRFCLRMERQARRRHRIVEDRVEVIETDAASGPLAFGIWRKVVAFPSDFAERYDADERTLALAHELTHHARGDLIANWAALVMLGLHWFNPIAWRAFRAYRADQEMACDAHVLAGRDPAFRHAYGRAIVKSAHGGAISAACHLHTINDLKGRLKMLSQGKKSRARMAGGAVVVIGVAIAGLGLTASGIQAAERMRAGANEPIGVSAGPTAPISPISPIVAAAPSAVAAPQTVPVPQSRVPQEALNSSPPIGSLPKTPSAPPAPQAPDESDAMSLSDAAHARHRDEHVTVIMRRADGSGDRRRVLMPEIPEISSANCPADGNPHQTVIHGTRSGKQTILICTNRIEKIAREAQDRVGNPKEIERNAYHQALHGLKAARGAMLAKGNQEGLKAIDEAIAEIEAGLAKVG